MATIDSSLPNVSINQSRQQQNISVTIERQTSDNSTDTNWKFYPKVPNNTPNNHHHHGNNSLHCNPNSSMIAHSKQYHFNHRKHHKSQSFNTQKSKKKKHKKKIYNNLDSTNMDSINAIISMKQLRSRTKSP